MPEAAATPPSTLAVMIQFIIPFGMMFLIFYVLVFRPQAKTRKEHDMMLKSLKKHDEVVTSGGLIGTVVNVKPEIITLRIDEGVRVEVERSAIVRVSKPHGAPAVLVPPGKKS